MQIYIKNLFISANIRIKENKKLKKKLTDLGNLESKNPNFKFRKNLLAYIKKSMIENKSKLSVSTLN